MTVTRAGSAAGTRPPVQIQPGSSWRPSPSLDQARQGSDLIKQGQAGESVRQLQDMLRAAGVQVEADGLFGSDTKAAVQRFQRQNHLDPDGVVGADTMRALDGRGAVSSDNRADTDRVTGNRGNLSAASERQPDVGTGQPGRATGVHGLLGGGSNRITRNDIDWNHPQIAPPGGRVTKPSAAAFKAAVNAYEHAKDKGQVRNHKMTLIDFSRPSTEPRMWVIDMDSKKLLAQHRVAHGSGSGDPRDARMASRFSDRNGSHQSALGTYITAETYSGSHGYSLKLDGKERGFNASARGRAIVMHPADYASDAFVRQNGYLGRSWGCPAMDPAVSRRIIDMVKGGSAMMIYSDDSNYLSRSEYARD